MSPFLLGVSLSSLDRVLGRTLVCTHGEASGFFVLKRQVFEFDLCHLNWLYPQALIINNTNEEVWLWNSRSSALGAISIIQSMNRSSGKTSSVPFVENSLPSENHLFLLQQ